MDFIRTIKHKLIQAALPAIIFGGMLAPAHAAFDFGGASGAPVNLSAYGYSDVAPTAECITQRMSPALTNAIGRYYFPVTTQITFTSACSLPQSGMRSEDVAAARKEFLGAWSLCTGQTQTDDYSPGARRIAAAVSLVALHGLTIEVPQNIRDQYETLGQQAPIEITLLDKYNTGAHVCNDPKPKAQSAVRR